MHSCRWVWGLAAVVLFPVCAAAGQADRAIQPITFSSLQCSPGVDDLLAELRSSGGADAVLTRIERLLDADPAAGHCRELQEAVAEVMARKNAEIRHNYDHQIETDRGDAESYSMLLLPLALRLLVTPGAPPHSASFVRALVHGIYNPESEFSRELARYGAPVLPHALELAHRGDELERQNGYFLLGAVVAANREGTQTYPLTAGQVQQAVEAVRSGLNDPDATVRGEAIAGVVAAGDKAAIPLLQHMALHDPDGPTGAPFPYSVRERAAAAVKTLQRAPR